MGLLPNLVAALVIFCFGLAVVAVFTFGAFLLRKAVMPEPGTMRTVLTSVWLFFAAMILLIVASMAINALGIE